MLVFRHRPHPPLLIVLGVGESGDPMIPVGPGERGRVLQAHTRPPGCLVAPSQIIADRHGHGIDGEPLSGQGAVGGPERCDEVATATVVAQGHGGGPRETEELLGVSSEDDHATKGGRLTAFVSMS
jgi:hypothetical protein